MSDDFETQMTALLESLRKSATELDKVCATVGEARKRMRDAKTVEDAQLALCGYRELGDDEIGARFAGHRVTNIQSWNEFYKKWMPGASGSCRGIKYRTDLTRRQLMLVRGSAFPANDEERNWLSGGG